MLLSFLFGGGDWTRVLFGGSLFQIGFQFSRGPAPVRVKEMGFGHCDGLVTLGAMF